MHDDHDLTDEGFCLTCSFATFGPEVPALVVPALVRAGVRIWSYGYGDDADEFTTLDPSDLWAFEGADRDDDVVASWGPFRAEDIRR